MTTPTLPVAPVPAEDPKRKKQNEMLNGKQKDVDSGKPEEGEELVSFVTVIMVRIQVITFIVFSQKKISN